MKRLLLIVMLLVLGQDALAKYTAPSRSSSPKSYSAPSRSAPKKYTAPARPAATPKRYTAPARPAPPTVVYHNSTVVVHQPVYVRNTAMDYILFWHLMGSSRSSDPAGYVCHGGGCSQRVCEPLFP